MFDFGFFEFVNILDGEHGDEVVNLGKMRQWVSAYPLGGGIGIV